MLAWLRYPVRRRIRIVVFCILTRARNRVRLMFILCALISIAIPNFRTFIGRGLRRLRRSCSS